MGKKAAKSTRKFAASGNLKRTIDQRRKHQQIRRKAEAKQRKKGPAKGKGKERELENDEAESGLDDEEKHEERGARAKGKGKAKSMNVDDLLGMEGSDESEGTGDEDEDGDEDDEDEDEDDEEDDQSFASVDDLDDDGADHMEELSKLAEKDPEFYKYLQENDPELLDFTAAGANVDDDVDMDDEDTPRAPILTKEVLRRWQKAMLDQRSLRALRKLLIAFRSAAHMNEEDQVLAWSIDSPVVYNKLVTTALRYTPVVLEHHVPYKTLPNGKYKPPVQSAKQKTLGKLVLSHFHNVIHIIDQLTDPELIKLAVSESAKLVPYVVGSRKAVKAYLKVCLGQWSNAQDNVRIAAFLAMRRLASSTDESIMDLVLKGSYLTLVRTSRRTSVHTLPSINLMKNSASELYCIDHAIAYQHAFGYIRQLAIHLRNSMKVKTKESYKLVYNWQYVHSVDFWCLVLARACGQSVAESGSGDSELKALIYPLVQVTLGAIKLLSAPRSFPFHLHLARSLLHLTRHTHTYVPLGADLLPILGSTLSPTQGKKGGSLKPLDLETHIRAPQQYMRTRVYAGALADEAAFLLAEWLASPAVQGSVAFPELVVPLIVALRRAVKGAGKGGGKEAALVKALVERVEESSRWVAGRRAAVRFAPGDTGAVREWEREVNVEESPLGKYVKVQRKAREKRRMLLEKAREGEDEILEE